eukprot:TRINITY_DN33769_c0_g1_i1.p2 TRINITY_DN33769_c0_g1~~TRINITY_DN33769_c0_g1_i1.p2  ORF type:complete len:198 (+),score=38.63 TRINITY_DN33769_c0_g1_i1:46-594(+)
MGWGPLGLLRRLAPLSWWDDFEFDSFDLKDTVAVDDLGGHRATLKVLGTCPCRRYPDEVRLDVFDDPQDFAALRAEAKGLFAAPRRRATTEPLTPARTRVFVKTRLGEILPADVDLGWTVAEAIDHILAHCVSSILADSTDQSGTCNLRFRRKILSAEMTLKDCGAELGCVFGLLTCNDDKE